jgi:hypothetical protein
MTSSRDEVRAKLMDLQAGKCALCPATRRLSVDHDHDTGFARGLLCQSCNSREGHGRDHADIIAYRANPPAGPLFLLWDLPDWWTGHDTAEVRKLDPSYSNAAYTEYIRAHGARRREEIRQALTERIITVGRQREWKP